MRSTEVVIVGAGPYALSLAAHLSGAGVPFLIFGRPMEMWRNQMPSGMILKSDGFASNLADPAQSFELQHFCKEQGIDYDHTRIPVQLNTFVEYGLEFQRRLLPTLEQVMVTNVERDGDSFVTRLESGEEIRSRKVVLATGITYYAHIPEVLAALPAEAVSHSSAIRQPDQWMGKRVAIVGGGASALDLAALLNEAGAKVTMLARRSKIAFADPPSQQSRSYWSQLQSPTTGIGPGWRSRFATDLPGVFRRLPENYRLGVVRRYLGPFGGWPMKDRVIGKVDILTGVQVSAARCEGGEITLDLLNKTGESQALEFDHVIAATGYKVSLKRLPYLPDMLREQIRSIEDTPVLSADFESSVPGLFFVGVTAANTFGPVMRFAFGAKYTARVVSRRLKRSLRSSRKAYQATSPVSEQVGA